MKLNLRGHDDRYAIEQSLLAFFPEERPVYEGEDGDSHAEVTLHEGNVYATGVTTLTYGGKTARGEAAFGPQAFPTHTNGNACVSVR